MTIKFPSIIGIAEDGNVLVFDSKNKVRKLKKFNSKSGYVRYYGKPYDGPIIQQMQCSVPVDKVDTFEQWKAKNEIE
jgi:hypothetical protein